MIQAEQFVEQARILGYDFYTGVPCSFLTPFINYTIGDSKLDYVSSANEGDAMATAAGATLGGRRAIVMMQNSGLGNAINPLTSLLHTFRIPVLVIVTLRGDPELGDEPQHILMGQATPGLFELLDVPWEYFPSEPEQIAAVLSRAQAYMADTNRPYALIMRKGCVAPYALPKAKPIVAERTGLNAQDCAPSIPLQKKLTRQQVLQRIVDSTDISQTVIIATTGYAGRELFSLDDRPNHLYMVGSMGCAPALGLGLAMARPDLRVVVIDGDGASLMRMGNYATLGAYAGGNLTHIVLDNEVHDSTGAQATVSAGVSFAGIARSCGYPVVIEGDNLDVVDEVLSDKNMLGPRFAHIKIRPGAPDNLPRPTHSPEQITQRLMQHIGAHLSFATC